MVSMRIQRTLGQLIGEVGDEHAGTVETSSVIQMREFVDLQPLEHIRNHRHNVHRRSSTDRL